MTIQQDILIEQGATMDVLWDLNKDLSTGYTFAMKLRGQHGSSSVVLSVTTFSVAKVGSNTHVIPTVSHSTTAALAAPSMGVYDLEATKTSDGSVTREAEGSYYITPEATR
jgi:ABC-type uncharacterized transport system fused permease/ATPase subunit